MPTKRRRVTRQGMSADGEAALWSDVFDGGSFLRAGDDRELGVEFRGKEWEQAQPTPEYLAWREQVLVPAAREAWARLGADYLAGRLGRAHRADDPERSAWALEMFGRPS